MIRLPLKVAASASIFILSSFIPLSAKAELTIYYGVDYGAGAGTPRPSTTAAASAFDAAANARGGLQVVDFESSPLGSFNALSPAPGLVISGAPGVNLRAILDAPTSSQSNFSGYNTTVGGAKYNFLNGGYEDFSFTELSYGFAATITGVQNNAVYTITFIDGTSQTISFASLFNVGISGGAIFVGVLDSEARISNVRLTIANQLGVGDPVGVDDLRLVGSVPSPVPTPASLSMFSTGLLVLFLIARRRQLGVVRN